MIPNAWHFSLHRWVLCLRTGAEPEECRRLLIDIQARGFTLKDGREGWVYIKNRPLSTQ